MKIIDNAKLIHFCDLETGDVFKDFCGRYLIKMETIVNEYCRELNAVYLHNGECQYFQLDDDVLYVDCELVIK